MEPPPINETQCKEAALTVKNPFYLVPSVLSTSSSVFSFVVFFFIYFQFSFRIYYHVNAKILIALNMFSHLLFSSATLFNYAFLLQNVYFSTNDCQLLLLTSSCSILRRTFLFCTMLTALSQFSILFERVYATIKLSTYETQGKTAGVRIAYTSIIVSLLITLWVTSAEESNERLTNCFAFSSSNIGDRVYYMFAFQLALNVATWITYFFLYKYLARISKTYEGDVNKRYQAMESADILKNLGPLVLTSSAILSVYIIFSSTGYLLRPRFTLAGYKQLASIIFIMPHNSFISSLLYYHLCKKIFVDKKDRMSQTLSPRLKRPLSYMDGVTEFWEVAYKYRDLENGSPRSTTKIGFGYC
ncbi:hypothetical protein CAEBREN_17671 [Caenorhabditis brenneri]|uniref:G-protein coupled receptors family 1 profile domain-containing protein n=1 Tax=Caenorhabditis brenneri TaxID=135651 RepID=G0N1S8_CAEBE|nr:hypothetical protein CAEBREN_17671 [Caenorhabditis brenneri]